MKGKNFGFWVQGRASGKVRAVIEPLEVEGVLSTLTSLHVSIIRTWQDSLDVQHQMKTGKSDPSRVESSHPDKGKETRACETGLSISGCL
jgi:hypothetical protein